MASAAIALACPLASLAASESVAGGPFHTLLVRPDGTVLSWGSDRYGELGLGRAVTSATPTRVSALHSTKPGIATLAAGDAHVLALQSDGTVWSWGSNRSGQLGDGSTNDSPTPLQVQGLPAGIVAVAAGFDHSMALAADGSVWMWGKNQYGELGGGNLGNQALPARVAGLTDVVAISVGAGHAAAVRRDGTVWAWGNNQYGQLCDGTNTSRSTPAPAAIAHATRVAAGTWHTIIAKDDTTVWGCGFNNEGQVGDGTTVSRSTPVQAVGVNAVVVSAGGLSGTTPGVHASLAVAPDGTVWAWGAIYNGTGSTVTAPRKVAGLGGVVDVSMGGRHAVTRKSDGTVWTFGDNGSLQLGYPTSSFGSPDPGMALGVSSVTAAAGGGQFTVVATSDGSAYTWGANTDGQLGIPVQINRATPGVIPGLSGVVEVAAGGTGRFYQSHSLALKSDRTVWGWGSNFYGQLGHGVIATMSSSPVQIAGLDDVSGISAGGTYNLALRRGSVLGWGSAPAVIGTRANNPTGIADFALSNVTDISAGRWHALALRGDGTVLAWGDNRYGQLGFPSAETCLGPDSLPSPCTTTPTIIPGLTNVVKISAGARHSLAQKADGTVWAWGDNSYGELGDGTFTNHTAPAPVPGFSNALGILASGYDLDPGYAQSLAAKKDGTVWAWGSNNFGQLGDGSTVARNTPTLVPGVVPPIGGSMGLRHIVLLQSDGTVLTWGNNHFGQLGEGTFATRTKSAIVLRENGAGSIAGKDWFLDLNPGVPKTIPPERIPVFHTVTQGSAATAIVDVTTDVQFRPQDVGQPIFVFGYVPAGGVKRLAFSKAEKSDTTGCVLAQLLPDGTLQQVTPSSLQAYLSNVTTTQGQSVSILQNVPGTHIAGGTFCVGAGVQSTDPGNHQCVATVPGDFTCLPPEAGGNVAANAPGALSGLWWNPDESGWGISFTQRRNMLFAAWYTYDGAGHPKWYVASSCAMPAGTTGTSGSCSGPLYQVSGPTFFGTPFNPSLESVVQAGNLQVAFQDASHASMSYTVGNATRTIPITRQVFQVGTASPPVDFTDLWWNPGESGWGLSVTHQYGVMFLAWFVYDAGGNPVWYVVPSCTVAASGCTGTLYRTIGPAFGPAFDPAQVHATEAGTAQLIFTDANNGVLSYTVDGASSTKTITRQTF